MIKMCFLSLLRTKTVFSIIKGLNQKQLKEKNIPKVEPKIDHLKQTYLLHMMNIWKIKMKIVLV